MSTKIIGFLILAVFSIRPSAAQQPDSSSLIATSDEESSMDRLRVIDPLLFKEDFMMFKKALERVHPSLYRFKDKKTLNNLFDSCYSTLNQNTTETGFYSVIKFLLSSIEDGHLYCGPSEDFKKYFDERAKVFPLRLRFIKDDAYIICSNETSLPGETEIVSINDVPINKIKKELFRYIVSDGAIQTKKYWTLGNNFWFYYSVVYGPQSVFSVKYKVNDGKINTMTLNSDLKKNIDCGNPGVKHENHLQLAYEPGNIALLTIKTFNDDELTKSKEDFRAFLQSTFKELKERKTGKLIIDLRGNGGGMDDYGSLLYSYLTDKEFEYYASLETATEKRDKGTPFNPPLKSPGENNFKGQTNLKTQKPSENDFKGVVWFLIDGLSFSTTAEFCAIARSNNRGKFIGEETGGGYYGNTSGNSMETVLTNTKITISIPTTKYVMAVKKDKYSDRGIIPEYQIVPTIGDIVKNKDVQLNFALQLAAK